VAPAGDRERDLRGCGALRERAGRCPRPRSPRPGADGSPAGREGGEPRRGRCAARALPQPRSARRPLPPIRQLLPPPLRRARVRLRALRAHHALRRGRPRPQRLRTAHSRDDHVRARRGESRQQPRTRGCVAAPRLGSAHLLEPRRAQLDGVARLVPPTPRRAAPPRVDVTRRDLEVGPARVLAYGHWGRPVLVFPSELGKRWDWEDTGMIGALGDLIDVGRAKVYCADGADEWTWRADNVPLEERARRHADYERWIVESVAPLIHAETGGDI